MGKWVTLEDIHQWKHGSSTGPQLHAEQIQQVYCGLDCTGTREVFDVLYPRLTEATRKTYAWERAQQSPALAMMRRGVLVNVEKRKAVIRELKRTLRGLERSVDKLPTIRALWDKKEKDTGSCCNASRKDGKHKWQSHEVLVYEDKGKKKRKWVPVKGRKLEDHERVCEDCGTARLVRTPFNPNSSAAASHLFYDLLGMKPILGKTGEVTCDEEALLKMKERAEDLKKLAQKHPDLIDIIEGILSVRDCKKQLGFLNAKLSPDNRFMASFNPGGTWSGRWSSSKSSLGGGGNMQNIGEQHRFVFQADPGFELCYADLERAESLCVAHLAGDDAYLEAHEGDTHTYVARLLWPDLPWTGDIKKDGKIAKAHRPPWDDVEGHDYRFQAKRIQHGGNYGLSPGGIAMIAKIPFKAAEAAYHAYHDAFPHISGWQASVKKKVEASERLTNPLGREVQLFGRPWDGHTYKQGLAFGPQSCIADILNLGLWAVWFYHDDKVRILAQIHDAIMCEWEKDKRDIAVPALRSCMLLPCPVTDYRGNTRTMTIPVEVCVGQNWGKRGDKNPYGLCDVSKLELANESPRAA